MSEKDIVRLKLGDFQPRGSVGEQFLKRLSPFNLSLRAVQSIVKTLSVICDTHVERDTMRKRDLLIKWISENYEKIAVYEKYISLEFKART